MKKLAVIAFLSFSTFVMGTMAQAHYSGYYYGGYSHGSDFDGGGFGHGFAAGLVASTASLFALTLTDSSNHHKELVYIGAADEAVVYLQEGGEPSALLREALNAERDFLVQAKVENAAQFSDELLAQLVIERAATLSR